MNEILTIDGAMGEGGGSIIRLSVAFSVLFQKPIKITNIRAKRSKPGLRLQHVLGIKTLVSLTNSKISKCEVGTNELTFIPTNTKKVVQNQLEVEINTAASLGLLLQPIQIAALGFKNDEKMQLLLKGGATFGKWAPSINYLEHVTWELFKKARLIVQIEIKRHGFYPKGGALLHVSIQPPKKEKLNPLNLTELGDFDTISAEITCSSSLKRPRVAERLHDSIIHHLKKNLRKNYDIKHKYVPAYSSGVGACLWAKTDTGAIISSGTIIGEKGISSEEIGKKAVHEFLKYIQHDIPVDNYLSDQLIPLMAYSNEPSTIKVLEITQHARTNMELLKKFIPHKYKISKKNDYYLIQYL
ncbi:MAG: RNA 3'-terminal phosphate cyclase [Promethearchaeota archaeon]